MNSPERLHCHCSGRGEPLVLLHGWSMNMAVWQPMLERLVKRWRVYRLDLPGHGVSTVCSSAPDVGDWAAAVLEMIPEASHWVGWSLGGTIAMQIAASEPNIVKQLSLIAATPKFVASADWPNAVSPHIWQRFVEAFRQDPQQANQQFMQLQSLGVVGCRELGKTLQAMQSEGGEPSNEGLMQGLDILQQADMRQALSTLQCPISLIMGEHDKLVPIEAADAMLNINSRIKIQQVEGAGHVPLVSHVEATLAALELM